jgi:hypothetical protein
VLYRICDSNNAAPKGISGRTSYLLDRLAFHSYTQVIQIFFSRHWFGPPPPIKGVSTCSGIALQVSSLVHLIIRPIQTRFRCAYSYRIKQTRWIEVAGSCFNRHAVTPLQEHGASTACKHTVSGSFSLPARGSFHLSLTVLFAIGHKEYLALPSGPGSFRRSFTMINVLRIPLLSPPFRLRDSHPLWLSLPKIFDYDFDSFSRSYNPKMRAFWFGLFRFRSPLLTESNSLSFPPVTKMFQFTGFPSFRIHTVHSVWVPPFGYLRVVAHLQLAVAFRR